MSFSEQFSGTFYSMRKWQDLEKLWGTIQLDAEGWYCYLVGTDLPDQPLPAERLSTTLDELYQLLRREHEHDYCGIVYADNRDQPTMVKVYDPSNLGSSCGSSGQRILPRWVLSRLKPENLDDPAPLPGNRRRWWQRLMPGA